jgi:DNA-binding GntR family transcriptional regulator
VSVQEVRAQIDAYSEHSTRYRLAASSVSRADPRGREEHHRLLDLCLAGDVERAVDALSNNLMVTVKAVVEQDIFQADVPAT